MDPPFPSVTDRSGVRLTGHAGSRHRIQSAILFFVFVKPRFWNVCLSSESQTALINPAAVWLGCVRTVHVPPRNAVRTLAVLHTGVLVFHTCGRWTQTPVSHDQRAVFSLLGYEFDALARRDLSKWVLATECLPGQWWELPEMECFPLGWNLSSWVFFLKTYKALKLSFYK